jgi:hypothetical protein
MSTAPTAPAPSFTQRYQEEVSRGQQEIASRQKAVDDSSSYKPGFFQKLKAIGAGILGGVDAGRDVWNPQRTAAQAELNNAVATTKGNRLEIKNESGIADTEAQTRLRDLEGKKLQGELDAPQQPEHQDIVKEFSDALARGDQSRIDALQPRVKQFLDLTKPPKPEQDKLDKKIDEFVDQNNNRMNVMQRPDGTTYNVARGKERQSGSAPAGSSPDDPKQIADAIMRGEQPPDLHGLYRSNAPVRAELARKGFNLAKADEDWRATQKYLATLNGAQQVRLRQAVGFTRDSLDQLEGIYNEWQKVGATSGWKVFNKASLATAKQLPGAPGDLAHRLEARVADLTSELGTVYKGGNSSTDESLKLAAQNLGTDWNERTFRDALKDIRQSLQIRENSIKNTQVEGASPDNAYKPGGVGTPAREFGAAPAGKAEGSTGKLPDGTRVIVKNGRLVEQK